MYAYIHTLDATVIYTGAFSILTARPGRRSIYNRTKFEGNEKIVQLIKERNIERKTIKKKIKEKKWNTNI